MCVSSHLPPQPLYVQVRNSQVPRVDPTAGTNTVEKPACCSEHTAFGCKLLDKTSILLAEIQNNRAVYTGM